MKNKMKVIGNIYCAGVYGMRLKDSDSYLYCGSAIEINDALSRHLYNLKRGLYDNTNKVILQKYYDMGELVFEVIKESCHDKISEMSFEQKESLQKALSVLEEFYIDLYKESCCNSQRRVTKHSSNKDEFSTYKRSRSNTGSRNPNVKYLEEHICNILYLKQHGFNNKEINRIMKIQCGIDINTNYIYSVGNTKWVHIQGKYENWMDKYIDKNKVESIGVDTTSHNNTAFGDTVNL